MSVLSQVIRFWLYKEVIDKSIAYVLFFILLFVAFIEID